MEMSSTIYAKGMLKSEPNNGPVLNRSNSKIECAGLCLVREECHFYSYDKDKKLCDMDSVEKGWHFNYTETNKGHRNVYMDTGTITVNLYRVTMHNLCYELFQRTWTISYFLVGLTQVAKS